MADYDLPKLDPEKKALWLAALRSEEYKQGREQLRSPGDKFCCLGVACDVFRRDTGRGEWEEEADARFRGDYNFVVDAETEDCSWSSLPSSVVKWFGLPLVEGMSVGEATSLMDLRVIGPDGRPVPLSNLNDEGVPFAEIADLIERDL